MKVFAATVVHEVAGDYGGERYENEDPHAHAFSLRHMGSSNELLEDAALLQVGLHVFCEERQPPGQAPARLTRTLLGLSTLQLEFGH